MDYFELADNLAFGSQPSRKDMETLANKGIKTLVNLRSADEEEPERKAAQQLGMNFVNIPVNAATMNDVLSGRIHKALRKARKDGPVYVH